jgi:ATP-dependent Clp protease protease subunit
MKTIITKDPYIRPSVQDLITAPVVIRVGDITERCALDFSKSISEAYNTGQPIIPVVIDSYGGDVYALLSMLSDIESSPLPVATIGVGKVMSAATILLAHGNPGARFLDPNATVMIHEVSGASWWSKLTDMKVNMEETDRLNTMIYQKMAYACGYKDLSVFIKLLQKKNNIDIYMDAFETKKLKIIDKLGVPDFRMEISSKIELVYTEPEMVFDTKKPTKAKPKRRSTK